MPQFDVFRTTSSAIYPLVVDLQDDLHSKLSTRVVAPMVARARYKLPATRLTPTVRIRDDDYVILVPLLAAVPRSSFGELIGTLAAQRPALIAALDFLTTGS